MRRLLRWGVLLVLPAVLLAMPKGTGSLSVLLFSEGKPLVANEIRVDNKSSFHTDADGALNISLPAGNHQIEIIGRDKSGVNLGYFKKQILIKEGRSTEVIATLSKSGDDSIDIDTPVKVAASIQRKEQQATGTGILKGRVLSSEGNSPVGGARVFVRGTAVDVRTDEGGYFSAKVPSGKTLSISVVHSAYSAQTIGGIVVQKDGVSSRTVKLTPASMELEEFVVLAPKVEGSLTDVITEEKNTNAVANILGSEEMSKKGDSTAAAALKRVTGVTLVDGKSIYVRGLGERYSNVELNSMPLPSPDPMKRSVPLDIFPSSVIGSMKIQKSASADVPSSFGGGYIDLRTKESFDEDYIKISLGTKVNKETGNAHIDYIGSATDWMGYDFSYRDIPQALLDATSVHVGEAPNSFTTEDFSEEELSQFTQLFANRIYGLTQSALKPGISGSIEGAKIYKFDNDHKLSAFATYGYSQETTNVSQNYYKYDYDINGELKSDPTQYGTIDQTLMNVSHGGMLNLAYNFSDVFSLSYVKLYTKDATKATRLTDGILGSNDEHMMIYNLDWSERELNTDQLNGEFDYQLFNLDSTLSFGAQQSTANYYQPNNYQYIYNVTDQTTYLYTKLSANNLANRIDSNDVLESFYIKNKHEFDWLNDSESLEYGVSFSSKTRISRQNRFRLAKVSGSFIDDEYMVQDIDTLYNYYVLPDYPYTYRPFLLTSFVQPADFFDGYVDETDPYISLLLKPSDKIEAVFGLRYVSLTQQIDEYAKDVTNPDVFLRNNIQIFTTKLEVQDLFPSFSLKYKVNEKNIFDVAVSKTYIMPDLRETSGIYSHPFEPATIMGNPNLVNTLLYNFDLKYGYFMSEDEFLKMGIFYKYLDKPIEDTQELSSSLPIYSFTNTDYATLYGFEIDARKDFYFLSNVLKNYYLSGNFSYNISEVTLTDNQTLSYSTNHRALQGLSPYVLNVTLGYDNDERSVALNLNYMSERIRKIGVVDGDVFEDDQYETPPMLLDLVWLEKFDYGYPFELKMKIGNILDDEIIWKEGDGITRLYKTGPTVDLKISSKF